MAGALREVLAGGVRPPRFREGCRLAWADLDVPLRAAVVTLDDLVNVTTFLADRSHGAENGAIRREVLGGREVALTVVVAGIFDKGWLVVIEAVAAG